MDSNHSLSEVISYFIRLVINCIILIHVVPLALKWRKEKKILKQLESLASRLQLTATAPPSNYGNYSNTIPRSSKDIESNASSQDVCTEKNFGMDNQGYLQSHNYLHYGSQNEFDASIFGMNPSQYIGPPLPANMGKEYMAIIGKGKIKKIFKIIVKGFEHFNILNVFKTFKLLLTFV